MSGVESAGQYVTGKWVAGQRAKSDAAASCGQYYNLSGGDLEDCMVRSLPPGLGSGAPFVSSQKDPG